jgi:hypothetical protein
MVTAAELPDASPEDTPQLFHVLPLLTVDPDFKCIKSEFDEPFSIVGIYSVTNDLLSCQYAARRSATEVLRGPSQLNEKVAFHVTKGGLFNICQFGLDPRFSQKGFFGRGIHVALEPMKANDYSVHKGNPSVVRVMLRCKVLQGVSREFELGRFDRSLVMEPPNTDSVLGFLRRGTELAFYTSDRVLVTHIILYKFTDTVLETAPCLTVPPTVTGNVVYITATLSEFFSAMHHRAGPASSGPYIAIRALIARLLKMDILVPQFLAEASVILKAPAPLYLEAKLEAELAKCRLSIPQKTATTTPSIVEMPPAPQPTVEEAQPAANPAADIMIAAVPKVHEDMPTPNVAHDAFAADLVEPHRSKRQKRPSVVGVNP